MTQPPTENQDFQPATQPAEPFSPRRYRMIGVALVAVVIVIGGGFYLNRAPADAPEASNIEIKSSPETAAPTTEAIVKGGITDLLNEHPIEQAENPLDPLLLVAEAGLEKLRDTLKDYTATIERQERVGGKLMPTETISLKIRQSQTDAAGNIEVPRSIYTRHVAPKSLKGQEAIWVEGQNDNKLIAHTTGLLNLKSFYLPPDGMLAMRGSRYPMTEAGFEVLIQRMLERGQRDREYGSCVVNVDRNVVVNGRPCTMFEIRHDEQEGPYDFHIARIAIDDELDLPIHYEALTWPEEEGGEPQLLERYTYTDIVINPGLSDMDFDITNPAYDYPGN